MSTPMVQAEKDGRKTMTRRTTGLEEINEAPDKWEFSHFVENPKGGLNAVFKVSAGHEFELGAHFSIRCPYGKPGDILWVRETAARVVPAYILIGKRYIYKADGYDNRFGPVKWKPSIHMPKEAARIWLEVTDIRVERLHNITDADAIAEGVEKRPDSDSSTKYNYKHYRYGGYDVGARVSFRTLWEVINGEESWAENPWVWVVSFKILSTTGNPAGLEREVGG